MGAASNPTVTVREQAAGGYVAVDTETGTRVSAESRFFASVALALKIEGRDELSAEITSVTTVEELVAVVAGRLSDDDAAAAKLIERWAAADDGRHAASDARPDPSVIRGIASGATDRSPRELVAESRAKDREREERLTDAG